MSRLGINAKGEEIILLAKRVGGEAEFRMRGPLVLFGLFASGAYLHVIASVLSTALQLILTSGTTIHQIYSAVGTITGTDMVGRYGGISVSSPAI